MKTLVINELKRSQRPTGCSSWFASFDEVDVLRFDLTKDVQSVISIYTEHRIIPK